MADTAIKVPKRFTAEEIERAFGSDYLQEFTLKVKGASMYTDTARRRALNADALAKARVLFEGEASVSARSWQSAVPVIRYWWEEAPSRIRQHVMSFIAAEERALKGEAAEATEGAEADDEAREEPSDPPTLAPQSRPRGRPRGRRAPAPRARRSRATITDPDILEKRRQALAKARQTLAEKRAKAAS